MADTVVRAVTLPVAAPVDLDWRQLDAALNPAFRLATDLANWCVRRLFMLDNPTTAKTPEVVKKWYGYKDASENYPQAREWAGAMASFNLVIRNVQRKYIQQRFDVIVRNDSSLLTYRFPQPYPVHNQSWSLELTEAGPILSLALPGTGRISLRLRQGREFGRQLAMLRQLLDGSAKKGEAALSRDRKGKLRAKMVGTFPVRQRTGAPVNVAYLHTDAAALLVLEVNERKVNITNGDHIKRAVAVHKTFLQRASEDKKREVRMDRQHRANFNKAIDTRCAKQRDRVDTAIKQVSRQVARICERMGVGLVAYDDACREFIPEGFPWAALKERLRQLLVDELDCEWVDGQFTHLKDQKEKDVWLSLVRNTLTASRKALARANRSGSHPAVTPRRPRKKSPPSTSPQPKNRPASARR